MVIVTLVSFILRGLIFKMFWFIITKSANFPLLNVPFSFSSCIEYAGSLVEHIKASSTVILSSGKNTFPQWSILLIAASIYTKGSGGETNQSLPNAQTAPFFNKELNA